MNCKICGKPYETDNPTHTICGKACRIVNDRRRERARYQNNRQQILAKTREYYQQNKEYLKVYFKAYYLENKDWIKEKARESYHQKKGAK